MDRDRKIDSVKMMREIRGRLSKKFGQMTFEEQKKVHGKKIGPEVQWPATRRLQPTAEKRGG